MSTSTGNEIDEMSHRMNGVVVAVIQASTMLAQALIELRVEALRRAAQQHREQAEQVRQQMRAHHAADAAVWRAAMRPQWWRDAGAEDISRVWRAASTWQHVDPRAAEARQVVVDRLAERGVHVDPHAQGWPTREDVARLSDALDRVAAAKAAAAAAEPARGPAARAAASTASGTTARPTPSGEVIDGELRDGTAPRRDPAQERADREARAAGHVRAAWSAERADAVLGCKAWGALAYQLGQLEEQGHDVEVLLRGVPGFVDQAHTPAAFAFRSIEDHLADVAEREAAVAAAATTERGDAEASLPFGPVGLSSREVGGLRYADGASDEQVRAAGEAYWTHRLQTAQEESQAAAPNGTSLVRDEAGHTAGDRVIVAHNAVQAYRDTTTSGYWKLGGETPQARAGVLATLAHRQDLADEAGAERAAAAAHRSAERDERARQDRGEQVVTDPAGVGQAAAAEARGRADEHARRADSHEVRAAQLASQGFPTSTAEAVAATAERTKARAAAGKGGRPAAQQPGAQRVRRDQWGR